MSESYKNLDLDYTYTDPETGLLRDLADISDPDVLLFFESGAVAKRIQELYEKPIKIANLKPHPSHVFPKYQLLVAKNIDQFKSQ